MIAFETSNDIIARNGSILSSHEYVLIIMFKKINYVRELFILFSFDASYCIINVSNLIKIYVTEMFKLKARPFPMPFYNNLK